MSSEQVIGDAVARLLDGEERRPLVVGICGAQGSGKSTIAQALAARFSRSVTLSLDDLYMTRAERYRLAEEVHPLFATRGVPGTHDVALGLATLEALASGTSVDLPRFDKARDDRLPRADWPLARSPVELVFLEGWCVGAVPQAAEALDDPLNGLEREEDVDGKWRRAVNAALAGAYQQLFAWVDYLILLAAPDWETVVAWRQEQEAQLRESGASGAGVMDEAQVNHFVAHYERLTRHILEEMPARADLILQLRPDRSCRDIHRRDGRNPQLNKSEISVRGKADV